MVRSCRKDLFFNNLMVLGFDVQIMQEKYRISFDKEMFCLPNQLAFEVVSHFLFMKLNEVSAYKYSILWPLLKAEDHRGFQKTCIDHLKSIALKSEIRFPTVSRSVLSSFGDEFYKLYFAFSTHVVLKTNESFGVPLLKRPQANFQLHKYCVKVMQLLTTTSAKIFDETTNLSRHHLETYFNCAKSFMILISELKSAIASSQALLENKCRESPLDDISLKEYQKKIEKYWTQLESFISNEDNLWNILCNELEKDKETILEGSHYNLSRLEDFLNQSHCYQHKHSLWTENKGLNFCEFLKMFTCILELYSKTILKSKILHVHQFSLLKNQSECDATLERLKQLSDQLESDNVLTKNGTRELRDSIQFDEDDNKDRDFINKLFEVIPPSPHTLMSQFPSLKLVEDESVLSNITTNPNNECSSNVSLESTCHNPMGLKNQILDSSLYAQSLPVPISPQKILKNSCVASTEKLSDLIMESNLDNNKLMKTCDNLESMPSGNSSDCNLLNCLTDESLNAQTLDQLIFLE